MSTAYEKLIDHMQAVVAQVLTRKWSLSANEHEAAGPHAVGLGSLVTPLTMRNIEVGVFNTKITLAIHRGEPRVQLADIEACLDGFLDYLRQQQITEQPPDLLWYRAPTGTARIGFMGPLWPVRGCTVTWTDLEAISKALLHCCTLSRTAGSVSFWVTDQYRGAMGMGTIHHFLGDGEGTCDASTTK